MDDARPPEPPILLQIGLALTILKAAVAILFVGLLLLTGVGALSVGALAMVSEQVDQGLAALGATGVVVVALSGIFVTLQLVKIGVCVQCWRMDRGWLWVLVVLTVIGLVIELSTSPGCCFLPTLVDAIILVGAGQALATRSG